MPIAFRLRTKKEESMPANPYLAARREWDERYGDQINRAKNWRFMALLSGFVSLVAVAGVVHLSTRSRVVPFVVALDSFGRTVAAGPAEETNTADERLKKAAVFRWIDDLRLVTSDAFAQRKAIDRVYSHLAMGSQAHAFVQTFYRSDPPQKRAQTQTVNIEVKSVLANSDRTYEVEWVETTRDLNGGILTAEHWKGSFTVTLNAPTDERQMRVNPLGIYVSNAAWTRVF